MNLFSKRPHKNVLRFWAMILTGAILMTSLSGCMGEKLLPTELSFSQVEYERPDGQGVLDLIDKAKEQAENDILPFGMIWTLRKIGDATQEFYSMMTIAQIRNYLDVNDTFTVRKWNIWTPLMPEFRTAIIRCFLPLKIPAFHRYRI